MRPLLVLVLLCGSACIPEPDYRSEAGVSYFWETSSWESQIDLIEEQEGWFLSQLPGRIPKHVVEEHISHVRVILYGDPIPCGHPNGCNGEQKGWTLLVRNMGCPFNSAVTHEMMHLFVSHAFQARGDPEHARKELWQIADGQPRACPTL